VQDVRQRVGAEVAKVVVGQGAVVDSLLAAVAVGGHVLLEGPPGTAKTLLARAFAAALGLRFSRAQFTPDMLPSDLTGTMTLRGGELAFRGARSSPTCCSPTRSTGPPRRPRPHCWRRWASDR
jgi:MoxR-like ATPase